MKWDREPINTVGVRLAVALARDGDGRTAHAAGPRPRHAHGNNTAFARARRRHRASCRASSWKTSRPSTTTASRRAPSHGTVLRTYWSRNARTWFAWAEVGAHVRTVCSVGKPATGRPRSRRRSSRRGYDGLVLEASYVLKKLSPLIKTLSQRLAADGRQLIVTVSYAAAPTSPLAPWEKATGVAPTRPA